MPATIYWKGDAQAVAQLNTITVGGTWATGDIANALYNGKIVSFTVGATETIQAVVTGLAAAWNASVIREMTEITAAPGTTTITLTADVAGVPFTVTVSKTSASGTISIAITTASSGPNDVSTLTNWSAGALPGAGDTVIIENSASSLLYGLDALAAVTLAALHIRQSFTGTIGLPRTNGTTTSSYIEYRPTYLQVGATICSIGTNDGNGSGRIKIDFGAVQTALTVWNSGNSLETGLKSIIIKGTHASNTLTVMKGSVDVAPFASETAVIAALKVGYLDNQANDSDVRCSSGTTLTTLTQTGGKVNVASNCATIVNDAGDIVVDGTATSTTVTVRGRMIDRSTGTWAALILYGTYDRRQNLAAKTITAIAMYAGAVYRDPYGVVTVTNGVSLTTCTPEQVTLDIAPGKILTI